MLRCIINPQRTFGPRGPLRQSGVEVVSQLAQRRREGIARRHRRRRLITAAVSATAGLAVRGVLVLEHVPAEVGHGRALVLLWVGAAPAAAAAAPPAVIVGGVVGNDEAGGWGAEGEGAVDGGGGEEEGGEEDDQ
ncbi:hypothetical protein NL676_020695 [Syzygium grande]|nr:hypothetical protein NL676_020695 [Syzygium grande]